MRRSFSACTRSTGSRREKVSKSIRILPYNINMTTLNKPVDYSWVYFINLKYTAQDWAYFSRAISFCMVFFMYDLCYHIQDLVHSIGDGSIQVLARALEEEAIRSPQISPSCAVLAVSTADSCSQNHPPHQTRQSS